MKKEDCRLRCNGYYCENNLYCQRYADYQYGYQYGRSDKYKEITSEYMLLTEAQVEEIKADERAKINDELSEVQQILILYDVNTAEKRREIIDLLEQIKAQK